jgi:IPT/TIG domain
MSPLPTRSALRRTAGTACVATVLAGVLFACGGTTSEPRTEPLPVNPLPALIGINPSAIVAGSGATTLTLTGTGFIQGSQARWNDADRVTHYQSATSLTVDLPASDLVNVSTAKLVVVNGAPGGGTSGSLDVPVGYPKPQVTAISPATTPIQGGSGTLSITVTGTGFLPQSTVQLGGNQFGVSATSATQLVVSVPNYYLGTPGTLPLTVVNPSPGGGASNAVDFGVIYPTPTLAVASPDSSFVGSAFTLTVTGTGFGTGSIVQWNGQDRPTTYVNTTKLTADIPASDVGSPSVATLTVRNPTPGGGTSNTLSFPVVEPAPAITGVSPGFVTAGASSATVTITGTNFRSGATAQWNGANRTATLVSGTSMTVTLTAADLATPQTGKVTVTNPGASGISNAMAVAVVSAGPSLTVDRTVTLTHADLVYDASRNVLYASIPSTANQYANSIVRIDPTTGAVTGSVSVGSNPGTLAITDDGQYLYVGLLGAPTIVRVTLASLTKDIDIPVPIDSFFGNAYAEDIVPIPGAPHTIAASTFYTSVSPRNAGAYVFDDATKRISSSPSHTGSNRITRGPNASRIYGYNNETTEFGFRSVVVAVDGLHEETVKGNLIGGFNVDIEYDGGYVYSTNGVVVSLPAMTKVGTIPATGYVRPDASNARVHFLNGNSIYTYHYTEFTSLGTFTDVSLANHTKLVRWGTDGLAVGGGSTIVLLRGALVAQ